MPEPIENKVTKLLKTAEELYHSLVLIVGKCGTGKTSVIQNLGKQYKIEPINLNLNLSKELLELTIKQRKSNVSKILAQIVNGQEKTIFLDNIEILFDINLEYDPLRGLQDLSRNLAIVVSWNGTYNNGKLTYAEPGHPEYKSYNSYDVNNTLIVNMNSETTVNFKQ